MAKRGRPRTSIRDERGRRLAQVRTQWVHARARTRLRWQFTAEYRALVELWKEENPPTGPDWIDRDRRAWLAKAHSWATHELRRQYPVEYRQISASLYQEAHIPTEGTTP